LYADLLVDVVERQTPVGSETAVETETPVASETLPESVVEVNAAFGAETPGPLGLYQSFDGFLTGPLAAIAASDATPTVEVVLQEGFETQRRSQRDQLCRLLAALSEAVDLRIVASHRLLRWLDHTHRQQLPRVHEQVTADHSDLDASLVEAIETLGPKNRRVRLLEHLGEQDTETLSYAALDATLTVSRATMRGYVADLADLGLVESFGVQSARHVELTARGRQYLSHIHTVQQRLSDFDSADTPADSERDATTQDVDPAAADSGCSAEDGDHPAEMTAELAAADRVPKSRNRCDDSRVPRASTGGGEGDPGAATTMPLDRSTATTASAVAGEGGITLVDSGVDAWDTGGRGWALPHLHVDHRRGEVAVGVQPTGPLHTVASSALALWDPKAREELWGEVRLDPFEDLLDGGLQILQDIRTMGWISRETESAAAFVEEMGEAAQHLREMTTDLGRGNYEDRDQFRGEIMRLAHGMLGVAAQLADLVDVDLHYYFQIPEWSRNWDSHRRGELAETLSLMAAIQSSYCGHTSYRHLFESRPRKRDQSPSVEVDAAEPLGRVLSSFVVVGDGVTDFWREIETALEQQETHEDAPEFGIEVPVKTEIGREEWRAAVGRAAQLRGLTAPREAVQTAQLLAGSPFAAARGICRGLSRESKRRELRPDELRRALGTLSEDRLFPEQTPTVSAIVKALLEVDEPVSTSELAEIADVHRRSLRNNRDALVGLGVVEETDGVWELRLSQSYTDEERWPEGIEKEWTVPSTLSELAVETLPTEAWKALGEDEKETEAEAIAQLIHETGFVWMPSVDTIRDKWETFEQWESAVRAVWSPRMVGTWISLSGEQRVSQLGEVRQHSVSGGCATSPAT
jgi:hypothetical protein